MEDSTTANQALRWIVVKGGREVDHTSLGETNYVEIMNTRTRYGMMYVSRNGQAGVEAMGCPMC